MQHGIGLLVERREPREGSVFVPVVADLAGDEIAKFAPVAQIVDDDDIVAPIGVEAADEIAADEPGTTRHDEHDEASGVID